MAYNRYSIKWQNAIWLQDYLEHIVWHFILISYLENSALVLDTEYWMLDAGCWMHMCLCVSFEIHNAERILQNLSYCAKTRWPYFISWQQCSMEIGIKMAVLYRFTFYFPWVNSEVHFNIECAAWNHCNWHKLIEFYSRCLLNISFNLFTSLDNFKCALNKKCMSLLRIILLLFFVVNILCVYQNKCNFLTIRYKITILKHRQRLKWKRNFASIKISASTR